MEWNTNAVGSKLAINRLGLSCVSLGLIGIALSNILIIKHTHIGRCCLFSLKVNNDCVSVFSAALWMSFSGPFIYKPVQPVSVCTPLEI